MQKIVLFVLLLSTAQGFANPCYRKDVVPQVKNIFTTLPRLETPRLILRKITMDDLDDCAHMYADENVHKFLPFPLLKNKEDVEARMKRNIIFQYEAGNAAPWGIELKSTGKLIGWCGFFNISYKSASAEYGSALNSAYWNKGYMTEAKRAILDFAFGKMGLNRVYATVSPDNQGSLMVNLKLGFRVIGLIPEYYYYKGAYWDRYLMNLLKEDYVRLRNSSDIEEYFATSAN